MQYYYFVTDTLGKSEEEFWHMSLRRLFAYFRLEQERKKRAEHIKQLEKQNQALDQMRAL